MGLFHMDTTKTGLRRLSHTGIYFHDGVARLKFSSCAGMAYPGTMVGFAATWNAHGVYSTLHTFSTANQGIWARFYTGTTNCELRPYWQRAVQHCGQHRRVFNPAPYEELGSICIFKRSRFESHQKMAIIEVYEDGYSRYNVQENYSHFNMFKHLKIGIEHDEGDNSTRHRQKG